MYCAMPTEGAYSVHSRVLAECDLCPKRFQVPDTVMGRPVAARVVLTAVPRPGHAARQGPRSIAAAWPNEGRAMVASACASELVELLQGRRSR
jgi:hypothetical protein